MPRAPAARLALFFDSPEMTRGDYRVPVVLTLCDLMPRAVELASSSGLVDTDGSLLAWPFVARQVRGLAQTLVSHGVAPGDRVCVLHPRSTASFIAVHAILHAGAVMVPLDPMGPTAGLLEVIAAVEPAAIIGASPSMVQRLGSQLAASTELLVHHGPADTLLELGVTADRLVDYEMAVQTSREQTLPTPSSDDPAYIIFTSGSTGQPKGIVHTHASGLAYAEMGATAHEMTSQDRLAAISPLHFDQSTLDLYAVPFAGATAIAIREVELRFPANLSKRLESDRATMIYTTPYQLQQLAQRGDLDNRDLSGLRQIAFGGEAFSPNALVELAQSYPPAELLNVYGPAEVNGVTVHSFGVRPSDLASVSIGTACAGVDMLIVDEDDRPVTAGTSGEMLVHSPTMMRGYWRRDDLNSDSFVTIDGVRFYRTGDLAHIDDAGLLQFEGRRDNRIKVRGVRIELEEIERVLEDAPGVAHAVAGRLDDDAGMQHIAAWIVPTADTTVDGPELTNWCRDHLPANAVPTSYVEIDKVPTTATGKIDRATLRASARP